MTEAEWLACEEPRPMLEFLQGKASERKLRLFLIACARLEWDRMTDPALRRAVETAERYVEGHASAQELHETHTALYPTGEDRGLDPRARACGVSYDVYISLLGLAISCGFASRGLRQIERMNNWNNGTRLTGKRQPVLLRDIVAPFLRPFPTADTWGAWNNGAASPLAQTIYDERSFDRLPILGDALEDAGCADADLLTHLRGPGPHVRGCWALDRILGKK